ncbi:hypothetical protein O6P43_017303 [Quillaja saponaria]|uniref:Uncharacterized protein n=1 Tax=Quillaja saponaria TaxID=32244 RepID=A0AAD7LPL6_QUISA|nr:hypothetical protein O6P43_017303 [Quillaja saponaria]
MIMLDAIFIMEIVLRITDIIKCEMDFMLSKPWLRKGIEMDLLLLENQIPFFILEELYPLIPRTNTFLDLALQYFSDYDPQKKSSDKSVEIKPKKEILHFTDLVRFFYLPNMDFDFDRDTCDVLYSATKLNEAGVVFKHVNDKRLLDITFKKKRVLKWLPFLSCLPFINCLKAHLELSHFKIDSGTECVLRNLIALEQCHYPSSAYICNYFLLMDQLINTVTDTELLVQNKVLKNLLGSNKQGTILVNRLCEQVVVSNYCYVQIINQLNEHYDQFWNRNMAALNSV